MSPWIVLLLMALCFALLFFSGFIVELFRPSYVGRHRFPDDPRTFNYKRHLWRS